METFIASLRTLREKWSMLVLERAIPAAYRVIWLKMCLNIFRSREIHYHHRHHEVIETVPVSSIVGMAGGSRWFSPVGTLSQWLRLVSFLLFFSTMLFRRCSCTEFS